MKPEQLLDLLAERGWLSPRTLDSLRRQLADSHAAGKHVKASRLLEKLVERGKLSHTQAEEVRSVLRARRNAPPLEADGFVVVDDEEEEATQAATDVEKSRASRTPRPRRLSQASSRDAWGVGSKPELSPTPDLAADWAAEELGGNLSDLEIASSSTRRKGKRRDQFRNWNSPLVLFGGGGVLLLVLLVGGLYWALNRESADQVYANAEEAYRKEAYPSAIEQFDKFLKRFPSHPQASAAKVSRGLAKLWNTRAASDWALSLNTAREVIPTISSEAAFPTRHDELADLLPAIARGVAEDSSAVLTAQPENAEEAQAQIAAGKQARTSASEALAMLERYVPANLQPEAEAAAVQSTLVQLDRRIARAEAVEAALLAIDAAVEAGRPGEAFDARRGLVTEFPETVEFARLQTAMRRLTDDLQEAVVVDRSPVAATTAPSVVDPPVLLLPYHPRGEAAAAASGRTAVIAAADAVWAVDAGDGSLIWRVDAGGASGIEPIVVDSLVIGVDSRYQHLLALRAADGEVVWRCELLGPIRALDADGAYAVVAEGESVVRLVSLADGATQWRATLPQEVGAAVAVDAERRVAAAAADVGNVYFFDAESGACRDVAPLGHLDASLASATVYDGRVIFAEERLSGDALLHVFDLKQLGGEAPLKLGRYEFASTLLPPLRRAGRRIFACGRDQAVAAYELGDGVLLRTVAERGANDERTRRAARAAGGDVYFGGDGVMRLELQATRQTIDSRWQALSGTEVVGMPYADADVVLVLVRDADAETLSLVALSAADGRTAWSGVLSGPPGVADSVGREGTATLFLATGNAVAARRLSDDASERIASVGGQIVGPIADQGGDGDDLGTLVMSLREPSRWALVEDIPAFYEGRGKVLIPPPAPLLQPSAFAPRRFAGGMLVGDAAGRILLVDAKTAQPLAAPFQPPSQPGETWNWSQPAPVRSPWFAVAARPRKVFAVQYDDSPAALKLIAEVELPSDLSGELGALEDRVVAVGADGALSVIGPTGDPRLLGSLGSRPAWGPISLGDDSRQDVVLIATEDGRLHAIQDDRILWQVALKHGAPVGADRLGDDLFLAHATGWMTRINQLDGNVVNESQFGAAWGGAPVHGYFLGLVAPTIHGDWRRLNVEALDPERRAASISLLSTAR